MERTHISCMCSSKNSGFLLCKCLEFLCLLKLTWTLPHLCVSVVRHQSCVEHSQVLILSFVTDQKLDDGKAWEIGFSFSTLIRLQYKNVFPVIIAICTGLLFFWPHPHDKLLLEFSKACEKTVVS